MQRRKFLYGVGASAIGGSALVGSGAFSRVESQRQVSIEVAHDSEAYLGMDVITDSANSENYVDHDEKGHLYIDISESGNGGYGVNSDSFTYFDDLFQLCNNGKAKAYISYELPDPPEDRNIGDNWEAPHEDYDEQVVAFYWVGEDGERNIVEEGEEVPLELGDCYNIGLRTVTKSIDATEDEPLIDGEVVVTADAPEAGEPEDDPE